MTLDLLSLIVSTLAALVMAKAGFGYWALVVMTLSLPLTATLRFWLTTKWIPGMPRWHAGLLSSMRFGGTLTLNCLVSYIATNFEKILLGRFWGVEAL